MYVSPLLTGNFDDTSFLPKKLREITMMPSLKKEIMSKVEVHCSKTIQSYTNIFNRIIE